MRDEQNTTGNTTCWRTPNCSVIFLDFDGVLHPGISGSFCYKPAFEALMRQYPDVDIILVTSWRLNSEKDYLLQRFSPDIAGRIAGGTPDYRGRAPRFNEILAVVNHYGIEKWLVLDDDRREYPEPCPELISLDYYEALSGDGMQRVVSAFAEVF